MIAMESTTSADASLDEVAILLANRNGEKWLPILLDSLWRQRGVRIRLVASDNCSTDNSLRLLLDVCEQHPAELLPPHPYLDCAGKHFYRVIRDADIGDCEYVAFADNDDIWDEAKLANAISQLKVHEADGYSSRVTPFDEGGRSFIYPQSTHQKKYDYYFETGGAGCTIVVTRRLFEAFRIFMMKNDNVWSLYHHDWTLYAFARSQGYKWFIDPSSYVLYRQHGGNETGTNHGMRAALKRIRKVRSGWYHQQLATLASLFPCDFPGRRLGRLNWLDRLVLSMNAYHFRRRTRDVFMLVPLLFLLKKVAR